MQVEEFGAIAAAAINNFGARYDRLCIAASSDGRTFTVLYQHGDMHADRAFLTLELSHAYDARGLIARGIAAMLDRQP